MNYQYGNRFRPVGCVRDTATMPSAAPTSVGGARACCAHNNGTPVNLLGVAPTEGCAVTSLAMVYSPTQAFRDIYEPAKALNRGTLFAELDKPFCGGRNSGNH